MICSFAFGHGFDTEAVNSFHFQDEIIREVQERNIAALNCLLNQHRNSTIVVGTHGTALSTIINFYDKQFGYKNFEKIKGLMPWIVRFTFEDDVCVEIQPYNLFEL